MKQFIICILTMLALSACKSSKHAKASDTNSPKVIIQAQNQSNIELPNASNNETKVEQHSNSNTSATQIVDYAQQFQGVKYKYGGTTKKGMDCSGLVYESFKAFNIQLPRISRDMAKEGDRVDIKDVQVGDLLFFKTNKKRNTINHVGLVITALLGNIEFIHSTTSQGVIISSLAERYWYFSFAEARRLL
ncbi:C40 family peptidase [Yeosuana marina]|uniref:C40 family peptidase n=1 Tax=Yeosuana marina TaxID=1565536 RepID=UPI0030C807FF